MIINECDANMSIVNGFVSLSPFFCIINGDAT